MTNYNTITRRYNTARMMNFLYTVGFCSRRQLARVVKRTIEDLEHPYDGSALISNSLKPESRIIEYHKPMLGAKMLTPAEGSQQYVSWANASTPLPDVSKELFGLSINDYMKHLLYASILSQAYAAPDYDALGIGNKVWQALRPVILADEMQAISKERLQDASLGSIPLPDADTMLPDYMLAIKDKTIALYLATPDNKTELIASIADTPYTRNIVYCTDKQTAKDICMSKPLHTGIVTIIGYPILYTNQEVFTGSYVHMNDDGIFFNPIE